MAKSHKDKLEIKILIGALCVIIVILLFWVFSRPTNNEYNDCTDSLTTTRGLLSNAQDNITQLQNDKVNVSDKLNSCNTQLKSCLKELNASNASYESLMKEYLRLNASYWELDSRYNESQNNLTICTSALKIQQNQSNEILGVSIPKNIYVSYSYFFVIGLVFASFLSVRFKWFDLEKKTSETISIFIITFSILIFLGGYIGLAYLVKLVLAIFFSGIFSAIYHKYAKQ